MNRFFAGTLILWFSCIVSVLAQHSSFDSFVSKMSSQYKVDIALAPELVPTLDSILDSGTPVSSIDELLSLLVREEHLSYQIIDGNKLMLRRDFNPASPAQGTIIQGTIEDEHGVPLSYAAVHIINTTHGMQTDEHGRFSLSVADTTGMVEIDYLGFTPIKKPITYFLKESAAVRMKLQEVPLEEITIVIPYKELFADPSTQSLNFSQFEVITEEQLLHWNVQRLISTMTSYTQYSSDEGIRIRGVEPSNSLFLMDGLPVYNPYHFYNIFSPFNPDYFSSVKLYKNNLPVEYGGRIDGMIQLQSKQLDTADHLILESDLLLSGLEANVGLGANLSLRAGFRISHTGILNEDLRDSSVINFPSPGKFKNDNEWTTINEPTFNFYDMNLGLNGKLGARQQFYINGFTSSDRLKTNTLTELSIIRMDQELITFHQRYHSVDEWENVGGSAGLKTNFSSRSTLSVDAYYANYQNDEAYTSTYVESFFNMNHSTTNTGFQNSKLDNTGIKATYQKEINNKSQYKLGTDLNHYRVTLAAKENGSAYVTQEQKVLETTLFGEYEQWFGRHLLTVGGARITHLSDPGDVYLLPNLKASYFIGRHINLRTGFSQGVQAVHELTIENRFGRQMETLVLNDSQTGYPVLRSDKYMAGTGYTSTHFSFDMELFYKKLDGLMRVASLRPDPRHDDHDPPQNFYKLFTGNGWTKGMDITAYWKKGKTDVVIAYTLSKIAEQYDMLFNGKEFSPEADRRHQLKLSGKYNPGKFDLSTFVTYKSKAHYLSFVQLESHDGGGGQHGPGDVGMAEPTLVFAKLPEYFSLDFGVDYNFNLFKQTAQIGISLINATDHANIEEIQHLGRVSREGDNSLYITQQTELLGRTWNVHAKVIF